MALREQARERLQTMFTEWFSAEESQHNTSWIVAVAALVIALKIITYF
jgi:hypothetical protein